MGMERRTFLGAEIDVAALAQALADRLSGEGYEIQVLPAAGSGSMVQARKEDALRRFTGMSSALTAVLTREGEYVSVEVGGAHWADKRIAAGLGLFFFPALVTATVGVYQQYHLDHELWQFVEEYIRGHAKPREYEGSDSSTPQAVHCSNPQCNQLLPPGSKFCAACGAVVARSCLNCGHELESGAAHCARCGSAVAA